MNFSIPKIIKKSLPDMLRKGVQTEIDIFLMYFAFFYGRNSL